MEKPFTGKVAVVTGGSRGIGAATALVLAKRGFRVVVNYRASAPEAEEVVAAVSAAGGEAVAIHADVTASGDVTGMMGDIDKRWGGVDVLVHNALMPFAITSFADLTWEQLGGKLDRELLAAFLMTKAVVPGMISRGYGRLVYLSTGLSHQGPVHHGRPASFKCSCRLISCSIFVLDTPLFC
jgi:3-oxoacyl-[acyl-carrier protein] reductase